MMRSYNTFRTDLALENREHLGVEIPGVEMAVEEVEAVEAVVTWVAVTSEEGATAMGKPVGNYVTLETPIMQENDPPSHEMLADILAQKLMALCPLSPDASILVIGLGNRHVTPDALGPQVCDRLLVTRHLEGVVPIHQAGALRSVCAIAPGVMGITGIETAEIAKGIIDKVKPQLVVAIDALAARRTSRINATIQMTDTGINPGAGMGNQRTPINQSTMGVPVIAIGVPTVVDAATLVNDTMDNMLSAMAGAVPEGSDFYNMLATMEGADRYSLIAEVLEHGNMFVTPKEVDAVITRLAEIIASALNTALHQGA